MQNEIPENIAKGRRYFEAITQGEWLPMVAPHMHPTICIEGNQLHDVTLLPLTGAVNPNDVKWICWITNHAKELFDEVERLQGAERAMFQAMRTKAKSTPLSKIKGGMADIPLAKSKRFKSQKYLQYVRNQDCCICGHPAPNEAHHFGPRGFGQKTDDCLTVPLCHNHHALLQDIPIFNGRFKDPDSMKIQMYFYQTQARLQADWIAERVLHGKAY